MPKSEVANKTHVLTGSKAEIAENVARIDGVIREVIVIVEEPSDSVAASTVEAFFAEMEPYTVRVGSADYSRESLYTRLKDE